ncbi:hypothetical protein ACIRCZ_18630 [Leifsonia sp. NPDC102414]|uniref:hypothetical protein n=1 Tax=Leifsonia sp. NPDC102414 TaxID=3364124 RepID=UPI00380DD66D
MTIPVVAPAENVNLNCGWFDGACRVAQIGANIQTGVQDAVTDGSNAVLNGIASAFLVSWQQFELSFLTSWTQMPNLVDLNNPDGTAQWLSGVLLVFTGLFTLIGMLITSVYLMVTLRGDRARQYGVSLVAVLIVSNAGPAIIYVLDLAVHGITNWILQQGDITANASATEAVAFASMPGVYLIAAFIAIIGVLIQWGIMLVRATLIPLFVGVWPLSAAVATLGGKAPAMFQKITAWLIAFLIYPVAAAIVYVTAFRLKSGYDGIGGSIAGMILEVLAIFALPAIFRIIAPHTEALGKAYGGAIALKAAITVAETAVAVGAAVLTAGAAVAAFGAAKAGGAGAAAQSSAATAPNGAAASSGAGAAVGGDTGTVTGADSQTAPGATTGTPSGAPAASGSTTTTTPPATSGSAPAGAQQHPAANTNSPADRDDPGPRRRSDGGLEKIYARQQAAQAISGGVGRTARESLDDLDETIGGKHS